MEDGGGKTAGEDDEKIFLRLSSALCRVISFFVTFSEHKNTRKQTQTNTHTRHATPRNDDDDGDNIGIDDVIIVEDVREEDDEYHQRAPKRNDCFRI